MSAAVRAGTTAVPAQAQLRFIHILRSEFIKLSSVRSTAGCLATLVVVGIGISVALAMTMEASGAPDEPSVTFARDTFTLGTIMFGQLVAAVFGIIAMTSEYSTGTIQPTLMAVPGRLPVLAAKIVAVFSLTTATGLVTMFGGWAATFPLFEALGIGVSLTAPGFAFALIGGSVYLGLVSVFALGIGAIARSAAGGIAVVVGVLLILPVLLSLLGSSDITAYLLSSAGESMTHTATESSKFIDNGGWLLAPEVGSVVVLVWTAVSLAIGTILLRRRDA